MADKSQRERLQQAENLYKEKKYIDAFPIIEKLYYERSSSFQIKLLFGKVLKELNRKVETQKILNELDIQYPNNLNVLIELATFHYRLGNVDESIEYFNKVLFLDPYNNIAKERIQKIQEIKKNKIAERLEDTLTEFWDVSQNNSDQNAFSENILNENLPSSIEAEDILVKDNYNDESEIKQSFETGLEFKTEDTYFEQLAKNEFNSLFEPAKENKSQEIEKDDITQIKSFTEEIEFQKLPKQNIVTKHNEIAEIEFETESAADLYFRQGLFKEAQLIYKKLYLQTNDEKYFTKLNEIANIQSRTKEMEIIKKLTNFMNCIQEKGRNNVV